MNPQSKKKTNGMKGRVIASCPHSEDCAAPLYHSEVMASLDELSKSVGMLLERTEQHGDRLTSVGERIADVSQRQVVADQREAEWLSTLSGVEQAVAALRREERDA